MGWEQRGRGLITNGRSINALGIFFTSSLMLIIPAVCSPSYMLLDLGKGYISARHSKLVWDFFVEQEITDYC